MKPAMPSKLALLALAVGLVCLSTVPGADAKGSSSSSSRGSYGSSRSYTSRTTSSSYRSYGGYMSRSRSSMYYSRSYYYGNRMYYGPHYYPYSYYGSYHSCWSCARRTTAEKSTSMTVNIVAFKSVVALNFGSTKRDELYKSMVSLVHTSLGLKNYGIEMDDVSVRIKELETNIQAKNYTACAGKEATSEMTIQTRAGGYTVTSSTKPINMWPTTRCAVAEFVIFQVPEAMTTAQASTYNLKTTAAQTRFQAGTTATAFMTARTTWNSTQGYTAGELPTYEIVGSQFNLNSGSTSASFKTDTVTSQYDAEEDSGSAVGIILGIVFGLIFCIMCFSFFSNHHSGGHVMMHGEHFTTTTTTEHHGLLVDDSNSAGGGMQRVTDLSFAQLPAHLQHACAVLGYNQYIWDNDKPSQCSSSAWSALTPEQQQAGSQLGYTGALWDSDANPNPININAGAMAAKAQPVSNQPNPAFTSYAAPPTYGGGPPPPAQPPSYGGGPPPPAQPLSYGGAPAGNVMMAQPVAPQQNLMIVTVPQGVSPGQMIVVTSPQGTQLQVQVPPTVSAGQQFQVAMPAPTPQFAVASAVAMP